MRYVSLFSGIEAASVAWQPLGWEPVAFAEVEPFPCAVLARRWPHVPNLGDVRGIDWGEFASEHGAVDLVVGGSPCQSFSIAGRRDGLAGASGLMWEFVRAVRELRPRWLVWENVPGALSVERGEAFGQLLSSLDDCGYGLAWRVLDAQFARVAVRDDSGRLVGVAGPVAQRRRRVFLVGHPGAGRACEVLLEPEGMSGDSLTSREKREALARAAGRGARGGVATAFKYVAGAGAGTMPAYGDGTTPTVTADWHAPAVAIDYGREPRATDGLCHTLTRGGEGGTHVAVAHAMRMRAGRPGGGKGPLVQEDVSGTVATGNDQTVFAMLTSHTGSNGPNVAGDGASYTLATGAEQAVAFMQCGRGDVRLTGGDGSVAGCLCADVGVKQRNYVMASAHAHAEVEPDDLTPAITAHAERTAPILAVGCLTPWDTQARRVYGGGGLYPTLDAAGRSDNRAVLTGGGASGHAVTISDGSSWVVRRLTPTECERLMGFPDGHTDIGEWVDARGRTRRPADGPRYKALGNSMATNVMRWIGERIALVEARGEA